MERIRMRIVPYPEGTQVRVEQGPRRAILKAWFLEPPGHPRAVPALAEAVGLWMGGRVRVALAAAAAGSLCATKPWLDTIEALTPSSLYEVRIVAAAARAVRRGRLVLPGGKGR